MSPFVEQWDAPIDCFIKCPVFCQAPLPLPLLEIDEREFVGGGGRGGDLHVEQSHADQWQLAGEAATVSYQEGAASDVLANVC